MSNKLNLRIIHTHDTENNWDKCTTFVPNSGEIIVYDIDDKYTYERFKIGDGKTSVDKLPFTAEAYIRTLFNISNDNVIIADGGHITAYKKKEDSVT